MKIRPVRAELFMRTDEQTDGQMNMTKLIAAFRKFANVPKNVSYSCERNKTGLSESNDIVSLNLMFL